MSSQRPERLIATNATYIPSTKLPNIKKVKKVKPLKEEDVMTENNQDMEDKQNLFSERKLKQLKKSLLDYNVTSARQEDVLLSEEPNLLFSWISNKSENKEQERVMLFINELIVHI